jgi:hypothetical protein
MQQLIGPNVIASELFVMKTMVLFWMTACAYLCGTQNSSTACGAPPWVQDGCWPCKPGDAFHTAVRREYPISKPQNFINILYVRSHIGT